jgi:hypothetical protein
MKKRALSTLPAVLLAAVLGLGAIVASTTSQAAAPFQQKQVAGFHRTTVGAFEVTALLDATSTFDVTGSRPNRPRSNPWPPSSSRRMRSLPGQWLHS